MRFLVRVDAHPSFGIGHFMRCHAIAQYGHKIGHDFIFICADNTNFTLSIIKAAGYDFIQIKDQVASIQDAIHTLDVAQQKSTDFILLDGYHFKSDFRQKLAGNKSKIITIEDFDKEENIFADIILAPSLHTVKPVFQEANAASQILYGTNYTIVSPAILKHASDNTLSSGKDLLVSFGGSDPANLTLPVLKALATSNNWPKIHVVVGSAVQNLNEIRDFIGLSTGPFKLYIDCQDMGALMRKCSIAISAAGSTLNELATMGIPSISVIIADNQITNTKALEAMGITLPINAIDTDDKTSIGAEVALAALELKRLPERCDIMKNKARSIFDGKGIENFFKAIAISEKN